MEFGEMVTKIEEIDHQEMREFAEGLIAEATALGLEFRAYGYNQLGDEGGVHIFVYMLPGAGISRNAVDELFTRDDDSQPHACYTIFIGEIWHFVPYYC